jgi:hypothetical protein
LRGPAGREIQLELGKDFQPLATGGAGKAKAEVIFAGYGISAEKLDYDDYKNLDVEGKVVVIIRREPQQGDEKSAFDGKKTTSHSYIHTKLQQAKKHKAAAVLLVNDPFTTNTTKEDKLTAPGGFGTGPMGIPFAHVTQDLANKLLEASPVKSSDDKTLKTIGAIENAIDEAFTPISTPLTGWTAELEFAFEKVMTEVVNVVGVLEGEGELAEETIVLGAHYDHLGYGPFGSRRPNERAIHNGADDNASGTACVMELARRFAERKAKSKRRLVFIGFSAEERGIIGSNHYVSHPIFPLDKTVVMINFDMVGRLGNKGLNVGGVRSAAEFPALVEKANSNEDLKVNTSGPLGASDHAGFYHKEIPVLFFFTGMTNEYHTPEDDFETINVSGVVETVDYAERLLDGVIGLPKRPQYVKVQQPAQGRGAMSYLGVVPDYSGVDDGLKITEVNADSPAFKGGLKAGDVITKIGDVPVVDIQGLAAGLRKYKPGNKVEIIVRRGDETTKVTVVLGKPPG